MLKIFNKMLNNKIIYINDKKINNIINKNIKNYTNENNSIIKENTICCWNGCNNCVLNKKTKY